MRETILLIIFLLAHNLALAETLRTNSNECIYIVKHGDYVSKILSEVGLRPLWGVTGYIGQVKRINFLKNENIIFAHEKLILPGVSEAACSILGGQADIKNANERNDVTLIKPDVEIDSRKKYSSLEFGALGEWSELQGTNKSDGTQAHLLSTMNKAWHIAAIQNWSDQLSTSLFLASKKVQYIPEEHGVEFYNSISTLSTFGVGSDFQFNSKLFLQLKIEAEQLQFYTNYFGGGPGIEINNVMLLSFSTEVKYVFATIGPLDAKGVGGLDIISPGSFDNYSIKMGIGYSLGIEADRIFQNKNSFQSEILYRKRSQDTSLFEFNEQYLTVKIGYLWRF